MRKRSARAAARTKAAQPPRRKKQSLLPQKEVEERFQVLRLWIEEELSRSAVPTMHAIVKRGKALGLTPRETRTLVTGNIDAYKQTASLAFPSSTPFRAYVEKQLGILAGDIAFLGQRGSHELGRIGVSPRNAALVLRDITSKYSYVTHLNSRNQRDVLSGFQRVLKQHDAVFGASHRIQRVIFDAESSVGSKLLREFFKENQIRLHIVRYSKVGSAHSESLIRQLRSKLKRLKVNEATSQRKWRSLVQEVIDDMNNSKLVVGGKTMHFSPAEVTADTLPQFLSELEARDPASYFRFFSIDTGNLDFRFPVGSTVQLKRKFIGGNNPLEKRSEVAVDPQRFVVVDHVAYWSSRMKIVPCLSLRKASDDDPRIYVVPQEAAVAVDTLVTTQQAQR